MSSAILGSPALSVKQLGPFLWIALVAGVILFWGSNECVNRLEKHFIFSQPSSKIAAFWTRKCQGVQCQLCPRYCFLPEGERGLCRVRVNLNQTLYTQVYGLPASMHVDPIEKKPVFHLLPGSSAFSLATAGCNLNCSFCQNWTLSTANPEDLPTQFVSPEQIVNLAKESKCRSIAYTYSEPVVFYEYMFEIASAAHAAGLYNVMITAGYINERPLRRLLPFLDVVKVDLKGFDTQFYERIVNGELKYVQRTLKIVADSNTQLEVVNLIIPTLNDAPEQLTALCHWVGSELGMETPVFFSRFSPMHLMPNLSITPMETLIEARQIARRVGLKYVYLGNVIGPGAEDTLCPNCGLLLVERYGYAIVRNQLANRMSCPKCGQHIPGIWVDGK